MIGFQRVPITNTLGADIRVNRVYSGESVSSNLSRQSFSIVEFKVKDLLKPHSCG